MSERRKEAAFQPITSMLWSILLTSISGTYQNRDTGASLFPTSREKTGRYWPTRKLRATSVRYSETTVGQKHGTSCQCLICYLQGTKTKLVTGKRVTMCLMCHLTLLYRGISLYAATKDPNQSRQSAQNSKALRSSTKRPTLLQHTQQPSVGEEIGIKPHLTSQPIFTSSHTTSTHSGF